MASAAARQAQATPEEVEHRAKHESATARNFFDLRVIIGGLFTIYGIYLTIHGIFDGQEAIDKAAGVRINLWAGLGMLVMSAGFLLWAKLRPLTLERIVESQAESIDFERETDQMREEAGRFTTEEHRARQSQSPPGGH